jgi:restriction system protein
MLPTGSSVPVPDFESVMLPLLKLFADGQPHRTGDVIEQIADYFGLTPSERQETLDAGTRRIASNVGWARTDLGKAGLLTSVSRGTWRITNLGHELLKENPERLTRRFLSNRYPSHAAYASPAPAAAPRTRPSVPANISATVLSPVPVETPDETISRAYRVLQAALADELLEQIKANTPAFFERLVVKLLLTMGYGGSAEDAGRVLGGSHDGGIDGLIHEDKLGLDSIYVQAKRWDGVVGRPVVQAFVGSMAGQQAASKGVLLTTSTFSQDALQYVRGLNIRVVLIDGPTLARLMIEHGVGVTAISTYQIMRIDSDFFTEE